MGNSPRSRENYNEKRRHKRAVARTGPSANQEQTRLLQAEVQRLKKLVISHDMIRHEILKLASSKVEQPEWTLETKTHGKSPGCPCLLASDWHWGEVVDSKQIGGVNEYNLQIAHRRARSLIQNTIRILRNEFSRKEIPGIVFALAGDMVSGDIHEELSRTNEQPIMPIVLDLYGVLSEAIEQLADEFGKVFVPCVSGNHSRITHKPFAKDRNHLSFDWLLYSFLAKRFERDSRVKFRISDGTDVRFDIYGKRYLMTHGDQFRGGDGMIGALGPIIRGDHKKRSRASQIGDQYDTLVIGHFHNYIPMGQKLIVNSSLIGYNEYANANNFGFEPPQQALWLTHPERGITCHWPVFVDTPVAPHNGSWVSWEG